TGLTLTRAGAVDTILAASVDGPASATTSPFTVAPGAPAQLMMLHTSAAAGGWAGLTVAVVDDYGNLVTSYNGGVTLLWGPPPRGHAHPGRHAGIVATASGGIATFAHLRPATASRRHVLQAETDGLFAAVILTPSDRNTRIPRSPRTGPVTPSKR